MKCSKCQVNFNKALELFNGDLVCPNCFRSLTPAENDFRLDSDEWFRMSETYYMSYLELAAKNATETDDKEKKARAKKMSLYISRAMENCEKAAADHHPEAIVDMGYYYYKNYVKYDLGGIGRFRTAYRYFSCIIDRKNNDNLYELYNRFYAKKNDVTAARNARTKTEELISKAVFYLKDMYLYAPYEFMANIKGNIYSVSETNKMLAEQLEGLAIDYKIPENDKHFSESASKLDGIFDTIKKCTQNIRGHSPIFGIYEITASEYDSVLKFYNGLSSVDRGSISWLLVYEIGDGNSKDREEYDTAAFNYDRIDEIFSESKKVMLCFYNKNCQPKDIKLSGVKSAFFKKPDAGFKRVEELFNLNYDEELKSFVNFLTKDKPGANFLFYWDDAYFVTNFVMKKKGLKDISDGFLTFVSGDYNI